MKTFFCDAYNEAPGVVSRDQPGDRIRQRGQTSWTSRDRTGLPAGTGTKTVTLFSMRTTGWPVMAIIIAVR